MSQFLLTIEKIKNPPEKVYLMYQAINVLMDQNQDLKNLKVGEIARQAGIGKGTVYEYFSTKEELIANAIAYGISEEMERLMREVASQESFRSMMQIIFQWMRENRSRVGSNVNILQIYTGSGNCNEMLQECMSQELLQEARAFLAERVGQLLEAGYKEGLFTETDPAKRQLAFLTAVLEYSLASSGPKVMEEAELIDFVFESMIKALRD